MVSAALGHKRPEERALLLGRTLEVFSETLGQIVDIIPIEENAKELGRHSVGEGA